MYKIIIFDWDEHKRIVNVQKHKVDFTEAETVFFDEYAILFNDPDHSNDEERFLIIGQSHKGKILVVSHCYRNNEELIRIISARVATKKEEKIYFEGRMI